MKTSLPVNDDSNDNNGPPLVNRRVVLKGSAAGSLLLAVLPAGCSQAVSPPTGPVPGGNVSSVAVDTLGVVSGENVVLGRDGGGLYAMSAACTHAGCLLQTVGSTPSRGLGCPCHASLFDGNGAVTHGPAAVPLQHYRVDLAPDGAITIQGGQPVSADVRTPVG